MCEKHLTAKGETWSYERTEYSSIAAYVTLIKIQA